MATQTPTFGLRLPDGRRPRDRVDRADRYTAIAVVIAAAIGGAAAVTVGAKLPVAAVVVAVGVVCGLAAWRRSLVWMLYYLPFSGLLPLLLYPRTGPATLFKDFVFVGPAYVGAIAMWLRRRELFAVPRLPRVLLGMLTALVLVEAVNPRLARPLIGPIGVKVWLFYLPLLPLGYHMYSERGGLQRLLKGLTIVALVPCVLGILEAALVYTGHAGAVYALYGPAAAATTENFATFNLGSGSLTRISSIFTFVAQYYFFASATIVVAYAAWRGNRSDPTMRWLGPVAIAIAVFATMTSGLRAAFVFGPILALLIALLEGLNVRRVLIAAAGFGVAILVTLLALGIPLGPLASLTGGHTTDLFGFFGQGITFAIHHSIFGIGTGADTDQARYAFSVLDYSQIYAPLKGVWYESWYLKAFIELGVVGLVVFLALLWRLLAASLSAHRAVVVDPELRSMSAAFFALFIWTLLFSIKTAGIDQDPLDVYVWLFIGLQWKLASMLRISGGPP
jgi:hypothetical protein